MKPKSRASKVLDLLLELKGKDELLWYEKTKEHLQKHFPDAERIGLLEHLDEMGLSDKKAVDSYFAVLIHHLLKVRAATKEPSKSWIRSIDNSRFQLKRSFRQSKVLLNYGKKESFPDPTIYKAAKRRAERETGQTMPDENPFTFEQILDDEFYGTKS